LHTHSSCSDGTLEPAQLVARAALRQVALLALTDHDSVGGCEQALTACQRHGIRFVPGVELSCQWREREIHLVGLNVEPANPALRAHCAALLQRRRQRIAAMAQRLTAAGMPGAALAADALAAALPTRTHLARALCAQGFAPTPAKAFERWLQRGRPGYVRAQWPALAQALALIIGAGGVAVLAHPHRYRLSNSAQRELAGEFKTAGGAGIEVSLPGMGPGDTDRVAALARRYELMGSIGSDFHEPDLPWRPLGRFAKLPDRITPIMASLGL
jgi:predicted metal-dependent phosphoesterase TrpH